MIIVSIYGIEDKSRFNRAKSNARRPWNFFSKSKALMVDFFQFIVRQESSFFGGKHLAVPQLLNMFPSLYNVIESKDKIVEWIVQKFSEGGWIIRWRNFSGSEVARLDFFTSVSHGGSGKRDHPSYSQISLQMIQSSFYFRR